MKERTKEEIWKDYKKLMFILGDFEEKINKYENLFYESGNPSLDQQTIKERMIQDLDKLHSKIEEMIQKISFR